MAAALLAVAACGGPQPSIVLSLGSDAVVLVRGDEASVEVTLTRVGGVDGAVTLDVTGRPANVEASFAPAVLSGDTLTSTLTLTAAAAADEGEHSLTVVATGGGLTAEATLQLEVVSLTVQGRLVGSQGRPLPGVAVASQGQSTVTDIDGAFELSGLSVPYDLTAWSVTDEAAIVYQGLRESEVVLGGFLTSVGPVARSATVTGTLTGEAIPVGTNQIVAVCAEGLDGPAQGCDFVSPTETDFSVFVQWWGPETRSVRLHLLQIERDVSGVPVAYPGYATHDVELTAGTTPSVADPIDLGAALDTTEVELTVLSTSALYATIGAVQLGPNLATSVMVNNDGTAAFAVAMPVLPGATYTFLAATGTDDMAWVTGLTGGSATLIVPDAPALVAPANMATGVTTDTEFTVSNPGGGPLVWIWNDTATDYGLALLTTSTTVTMPDTSGLGLPLPAGATFDWQVIATGGDSVESAAYRPAEGLNFVSMLLGGSSPGFKGDGTIISSSSRQFTTAP